jgi:TonB family protein
LRFASWLIVAAALALAAGCGGGPEPGGKQANSLCPALQEDAAPVYYAENEVEIRARPVDPLQPSYPPRLRALGIEGDVEAQVIVLSDGSVGGARLVESTHDDFTAAVRDALREAKFHPGLRCGEPVSSWVTLKLHFRLED